MKPFSSVFSGDDCQSELKNNISSCVTEETADVSVFLTRGAGHGPPNVVYTAGDIDLHPHVTRSHSLKRAVTRTQETPTRLSVGFSDLISPLYCTKASVTNTEILL